jgi:phosphate transport system ATP-binding protein
LLADGPGFSSSEPSIAAEYGMINSTRQSRAPLNLGKRTSTPLDHSPVKRMDSTDTAQQADGAESDGRGREGLHVPRVHLAADETRKPQTMRVKASVEELNFYYGEHHALKNLNIPIAENQVTALIGPSGCGKSTFLRCFNRMHDLQAETRYEGRIVLQPDNLNLISKEIHAIEVRMRIGMVFQKPNPFPKTIFDNVAYGLRLRGRRNRALLKEEVEQALRGAALWDEVKDRLQDSALALSGGQMQRLCIARALVTKPEILLFDEPTSALDPIATAKIEELISTLREQVTVVIVTHNMQQAARVSDYTAFLYLGELVEFDEAAKIFTNPSKKATEDYITGRYG